IALCQQEQPHGVRGRTLKLFPPACVGTSAGRQGPTSDALFARPCISLLWGDPRERRKELLTDEFRRARSYECGVGGLSHRLRLAARFQCSNGACKIFGITLLHADTVDSGSEYFTKSRRVDIDRHTRHRGGLIHLVRYGTHHAWHIAHEPHAHVGIPDVAHNFLLWKEREKSDVVHPER